MQGFGDFDFLVGEWRITNERLMRCPAYSRAFVVSVTRA